MFFGLQIASVTDSLSFCFCLFFFDTVSLMLSSSWLSTIWNLFHSITVGKNLCNTNKTKSCDGNGSAQRFTTCFSSLFIHTVHAIFANQMTTKGKCYAANSSKHKGKHRPQMRMIEPR